MLNINENLDFLAIKRPLSGKNEDLYMRILKLQIYMFLLAFVEV